MNRLRSPGPPFSCSMAQADASVRDLFLAHREDAPGRDESALIHHGTAVMQRGLRVENRRDEFVREARIDCHAGLDIRLQINPALQREERTDAAAREFRHRLDELVHGRLFVPVHREEPVTAQFREHTT